MNVNQFDVQKAENELKNCSETIKIYVALLKKDNVKTNELLQKAIFKLKNETQNTKQD